MHLLRGFHATTAENAAGIVANGFRPSTKESEWLGHGIYFFQDTIDFARWWASRERKEGLIANPSIIAAEIEYDRFLDLCEPKFFPILQEFYAQLEKTGRSDYARAKNKQVAHSPGHAPRAHPLDCFVINAVADAAEAEGEPFNAVRAVFFEGVPLYDKSHLLDRQHLQIAVRNEKIIKRLTLVSS